MLLCLCQFLLCYSVSHNYLVHDVRVFFRKNCHFGWLGVYLLAFNQTMCYYISLHSINPKCICRSVCLAISVDDGFNLIRQSL